MEEYASTPSIRQIHKHGSVRSYRSEPVPIQMVEKIIAAGQRGSTSSNLQTYSVIAVSDKKMRDELTKLCGNQKHIRQAPIFLAWCADLSRLDTACQLRGYEQVTNHVESFLVAAVDVAIAMQTATIAAESLGLGMCYIGAIRNNPGEIVKLLKLPRLVFPISGMTIGWPEVEPRMRPRLPLKEVLHWEVHNQEGQKENLLDYDREMVTTGIYKGRQVPVPGQEGENEEYGWIEHSARRASRPIRVGLRDALSDQGFALE